MSSKYYTLRRNGSNCHIFEFDPNEFRFDSTIGTRGKLERLSKINGEPTPDEVTYAKLNGGFFAMNGSTEFLGTYVDDGVYYNAPTKAYPTIIFWKDTKKLDYCAMPTAEQLKTYQERAQFAMGVPWMLIIDGQENYLYTKKELVDWFGHPWTKNPRTLLGQKKDGTIVWVAVDGRKASSPGFTIVHSSALMKELGCQIACNLDGGGSTEMIVNGKIKNTLSGGCERAIGTALMCYAKGGTQNTPSSADNTQPSTVNPAAATGTVTASVLNVRKAPNTSASILGTLKKGATVVINGVSSGWYRIVFQSTNAWVSADYIKSNSKIPTGATTTTGVTTSALNMRKGPNTSYSKVSCIPKGTRITLESANNGWYHTTYKGVSGWCCGDFVKI